MQRDAQVGHRGEGQSLWYQNLGSYSQNHAPKEISLQQLEQLELTSFIINQTHQFRQQKDGHA